MQPAGRRIAIQIANPQIAYLAAAIWIAIWLAAAGARGGAAKRERAARGAAAGRQQIGYL